MTKFVSFMKHVLGDSVWLFDACMCVCVSNFGEAISTERVSRMISVSIVDKGHSGGAIVSLEPSLVE